MSSQTSRPLSLLSDFVRCPQLLTSSAVHKWGTEIHEGIYNMLMLLVELVAERVKQDPVPVNLMGVLTMVCALSSVCPRDAPVPSSTYWFTSGSRSHHRFVSVILLLIWICDI